MKYRRKIIVVVFTLGCQLAAGVALSMESPVEKNQLTLMPWPHELQQGDGHLTLSYPLNIIFPKYDSQRLRGNTQRLIQQWSRLGGDGIPTGIGKKTCFEIRVNRGAHNPGVVMQSDEGYQLEINQAGIVLTSQEPLGAIRGMQTLSQLLHVSEQGFRTLPYLLIKDSPRFKWRGVLLDSARHFIPLDVIKRQIDGMASAKMNVLHWHLTDDQGWRIESKAYPKLHKLGSDGLYYTQHEIKALVAYAGERGIRVVPEVDMPGHASAIAAAYPELISQPGPYDIERQWGIHKPTLNPTNEQVYDFVDELIKELSDLFPDPYFHIGGDEVDPEQWNKNEAIQLFIEQNKLKDHKGMQAYFNQRVERILSRYGKKMIGWDEIFHPSLSKDIVIQSWRGHDSLNQVVRDGGQGILSTGFYIDQPQPTDYHYRNDPNPVVESLEDHLLVDERWQSWSFVMPRLRGSAVAGEFTLITNAQGKRRGFIDFVGRSRKSLSHITIKHDQLRFSVDTWMGVFSPVVTLNNGKLDGYGVVANAHYDITGQQVGGSEVAHSSLSRGIVNPQLKPSEQARILGAEATLWAENVVADVVDLRMWPRTYAIAERLWSASDVNDVDWMYQRLNGISDWAERSVGLQHNAQLKQGMQRLTKHGDIKPLVILAEAVEQAQYYHRHHTRALADNYHQASTLNSFVDALPVENLTVRQLKKRIDFWLADPTNKSREVAVSGVFKRWLSNEVPLRTLLKSNTELSSMEPSVNSVMQVSSLGLSLINTIRDGDDISAEMEIQARETLIDAMQIQAETVVSAAYAVEKLLEFALE